MRKLFVASLKIIFRDKRALFWALLFPLIFTVVFSLFTRPSGGAGTVAVTVDQPSQASDAIVNGLASIEAIELERRDDFEAARREVEAGKIVMAIRIPAASQSGRVSIEVAFDQNDRQVTPILKSVVRELIHEVNLREAGVTEPAITVDEQGIAARDISAYDFYLPGFIAMGVMNAAIISVSAAMTQYREQKILKRILATPIPSRQFLAAQVLARLVLTVGQVAVILIVGASIGGHIFGNILWIFVLAAAGTLVFLNLGFTIAGRARSVASAEATANAIALPMLFLAGIFFPVALLPSWVRPIVHLLPLTPLVSAMRKVALEGMPLAEIGTDLIVLGAWVVISFALAALSFKMGEED